MSLYIANRVQQTSTSVGLGPFQPTGNVAGFSSWANSIPSSTDDVPYLIEAVAPSTNTPSGEWETGIGLWNGTALVRSTVIASSNGGAPVDFSAGTKLMSLTVNSAVVNEKANSAEVNSAIASVDNGATAKAQAAQDFAIQRGNHIGTQLSGTISDLPAATRAQVAAQIVPGDNVTITPSGSGANQTLTISSSVPTGDRGDITVTNGGLTWTVDPGAINTTKLGGDITAAGKALLNDADNAAQRATLGLGTLATQDGTFSGSSSGTNTGDQNLFRTIAVPGQGNVVADTTTDTLTLAAGPNVTITTDPLTDTITIAASGGGGGGGLSDGNYGDVTVSGTGTIININPGVVTTTELGGDITAAGKALLDDANNAAQRMTLGLVIGTDVQAQDAQLQALAGLVPAADRLPYFTGETTAALTPITSAARNFLDDTNQTEQRATLGLGTLATQDGTFSGTSSGTNTGDQNIFSTIAVAGQSNVVADTTSDTLTLVAGSNITLTTNASTDTITIAATGGGGGGGGGYYDLVADGGLVGNGVTENKTLFEAAVVAAGGNWMYLPPGDFVINNAIIQLGPSIPAFRLTGPGRILYRGERTGGIDLPAITIMGEWGEEITPTSITAIDNTKTLDPGGSTIALPSLTGWAINDVLKIYCDARYPFIDTSGNTTPFVAEHARVVKTDPATTSLCVPRLFSGPTYVTQLASGICRLRKMIPRPVEIDGATFVTTIDPSMDPPAPNNFPRSAAMILQGLVRAKIVANLDKCAGRGIDEQSCHESDIEVRTLEVYNGSANSRIRKVFGYAIDVHYSSSRGRYRFLSNTGRHTCTTDFDDSGIAFDLANYISFGGSFYPTFYDSEANNATGTPFDTHEFCFFPLWENCRVNGSLTYDGATGSNAFAHRAFSPTYNNCHAFDVKSGFDDSSAAYTYENLNPPNKGVARYNNCSVKMLSTPTLAAGVGLLLSGHPGPTPAAVNSTAQGVEVYNFRSSGGASGIEIRNVSTLKLRQIWVGEYSIAGIRFNTDYASTITNFVDMEDVEIYHTSTSSGSYSIRLSSANVRANIIMKDVRVTAPTILSRPTSAIIEATTTPAALTVEERGNVVCEYRQLQLVSGTLPAGAVVKTNTWGAGPTTPYGTVPSVGDISITVNNATSPCTLIWNDPLTANREITLDTLNRPKKGQQFRFVRTKNASGAFTLTVVANAATGFGSPGPAVTLTQGGPGVTVEFDGALWQRVV